MVSRYFATVFILTRFHCLAVFQWMSCLLANQYTCLSIENLDKRERVTCVAFAIVKMTD